MRVLLASVEVAPVAKVGGLADVAGSLPKALRGLGVDARIVMPAHPMALANPALGAAKTGHKFEVQVAGLAVEAEVWQGELGGVPVYLIDGGGYFDEGTKSEGVYVVERDGYLFFCAAALQACDVLGWAPDVVHANDWQTAFLPVFMRERWPGRWAKAGALYTIHNMAYQGQFGPDTLEAAGLPVSLYDAEHLEAFGEVNFLKAGCVYSDQVNTVSPTYAQEIQGPEHGYTLYGLMKWLAENGKLHGILNGIDTEVWDPSRDPAIAANYSAADLDGKAKCRAALCDELGVPNDDVPIAGMVTRLSSQKGFEFIVEGLRGFGDKPPIRLVVLGTGDPWATQELAKLEQALPGYVRFVEGYREELAPKIYASADIFLMPSNFEPCGLGQMIALRYGTVPVVRRTGGLADTVFEGLNGFAFDAPSTEELWAAVGRAAEVFRTKGPWRDLVVTGMKGDYSWAASAGEYVRVYEQALARRGS